MFTLKTRWFLDRQHVIKRIGKGKAKALTTAGAIVYRSVQKELKSGTPSQNGTNRQIGAFRGLPLLEKRKRNSRAGVITSWRTPRNPRGFLRSAMAFAYDPTSESVVVGPRKMDSSFSPRLNELHERGGTQTQRLFLRFRGRPVSRQRAYGLRRTGNRANLVYVGSFMHPRPRTSNFLATGRTRTARVPRGQFQAKGLQRVIDRIPRQFRDQISGP